MDEGLHGIPIFPAFSRTPVNILGKRIVRNVFENLPQAASVKAGKAFIVTEHSCTHRHACVADLPFPDIPLLLLEPFRPGPPPQNCG